MNKLKLSSVLDRHTNDYDDVMLKISRDLQLIGEIDEEAKALQDEAENRTEIFFKKASNIPLEESKENVSQIKELYKKAMTLSDDKIDIADDMVMMVEMQLEKLDLDLEKYSKVQKSKEELQTSYLEGKTVCDKNEAEYLGPAHSEFAIKYCTCKTVAFGNMIACDGPQCPIEWFHYECVGITKAPKGKWLCEECSVDR